MQNNPHALGATHRAMGSSLARTDAPAKTTGQVRYAGDMERPHQKWMKVVFAEVSHARIRSLKVDRAAALPGVTAVLTDADVPHNRYGIVFPDQPVLCGLHSTPEARTVRWAGDRLCLIVADSPRIAEAAAQLVEVEYDPLPVLDSPRAALAPDAVLVHDYEGYPLDTKPRSSNLLSELRIRYGDPARGMAEADVIVDGEFQTHPQEHAYLETEAGVAWMSDADRIIVRTGGQWMHHDQAQIAEALQVPAARIRVEYAAIGGAFGGKEDVHLQILLALATYRTGAPVKCVWTREESIRFHHKRHPFHFRARLGARQDGSLTALEVDLESDAGAYASTSTKVLGNAVLGCHGCYIIPHVRIDGRTVFTNNGVNGAFRGFGSPQGLFMIETLMNQLAERLEMDPGELRRRNAWREGTTLFTASQVPPGVMARAVLDRVEAEVRRLDRQGDPAPAEDSRSGMRGSLASAADRRVRGRGLALGVKNVGFGQGVPDSCHAWIELRGEAEIEEALVGTVGADTGQGAHMVVRQMAADLLRLPLARVRLKAASTDDAQSSGSASASRLTYYAGGALYEAAQRALREWENEERPARGEYTWSGRPTTPHDPETGAGSPAVTFGYCAQVADIEVDLDTGHISVLRIISVHDVGRAVNPQLVEGQIEGAVAQGMGWTLSEHLIQAEGRIANPSLSTYLIPGVRDVPAEVVPVILEGGVMDHPLHLKGMAEMGTVPVAAAITAAVHDALGIWITRLPLTPEAVWRAMVNREG